MDRDKFEQLVSMAIDALPDEFANRLENITLVVQDWPNSDQLNRLGLRYGQSLLGLYEGVPLTRRGVHYGLIQPDKITIFQKPIERKCGQNYNKVADEIARVVKHEIAHHFGITDARLKELDK